MSDTPSTGPVKITKAEAEDMKQSLKDADGLLAQIADLEDLGLTLQPAKDALNFAKKAGEKFLKNFAD